MSIRLRLTVLYSVILALTLIVFSTILFVIQSKVTFDAIKDTLAHQVQDIVAQENHRPPMGNLPPPQSQLQSQLQPQPQPQPQSQSNMPGRWTQIRAVDGTVVMRTADLGDTTLPLSEAGLRAVQSGSPWVETAQVDGDPLLIFSQQIGNPTLGYRVLQIASPIAEREQSLNTLRWILIVGSSLVILTAFVIGWGLAGTALLPIHRITNTAQAIGAERDLSRRVRYAGPNDEIGQLATTFNTMLTELETAYRQVEQALQAQRRFVADASHELRTPLTTVRGNIELLRHEPPLDPRERADVLADAKDEVERLIRLVQQLLVLARADAGRPVRHEPLPVKPLVEDVCRQAKLLAPQRTIAYDALPEVSALGDRDALKQVLLVLVDNALIHTPPSATIQMSVTTSDQCVTIGVEDTGPGIASHLLNKIFERFYRGDASRSGGGAGLGLSIAKELVQAQSGSITVTSEIGVGTTFAVTMPRVEELSPR